MTHWACPVLKKTCSISKQIGIDYPLTNGVPYVNKPKSTLPKIKRTETKIYHLTNWQTLAVALRVRWYLVRKWPLVTYRAAIHHIVDVVFRWIETPLKRGEI